MQKGKFLAVVVFMFLIFHGNAHSSSKTDPGDSTSKRFILNITQGDQKVRIGNGQTVTVKKEPFAFEFVSESTTGFLVNISTNGAFLDDLLKGVPHEKIPVLGGGVGIAEGKGNKERMARYSNKASNYWSDTRFDKHEHLKTGEHVMTRTIEALKDRKMGKIIPLEDIGSRTFYVCVLTKKKVPGKLEWKEIQRLGFTLKFGEEMSITGDTIKVVKREDAVQGKEMDSADMSDTSGICTVQFPNKPKMECFRLVGKDKSGEVLYDEKNCPDQLKAVDGNYEMTFASLISGLDYSLEVVFPNNRSYPIFSEWRKDQLVGQKVQFGHRKANFAK
ncbi:MAG: hypothetical protein ACLFQB_08400 [Chitinispirillaceae bacterium]